MTDIAKEALDMVEDLNNLLLERGGLDYYYPFVFKSTGWQGSCIEFMSVCIWTECDEPRKFIENKNEYESLRDFLIKESKKVLADLNNRMSIFL
jgi:hypothetical protein